METSANPKGLTLSQDAMVVLVLARTSLPFTASRAEEAERWLRIMRVHGHVGVALQNLGVGEAPLEAPSDGPQPRPHWQQGRRHDETVRDVCRRARGLADRAGADTVRTTHLLSAVLALYGLVFDRELYRRGTSRDEVLAQLAGDPVIASAYA